MVKEMKATYRTKYGLPDAIQVKNIEKPIPKSDEVLIRVHATTVNRTDCGVLTGLPLVFRFFVGFPRPKKAVLGTDFAGEVVAMGEKATSFKVGDQVFGFYDEGAATQAEYVAFSEKKAIAIIPPNVTFEEAVASLEGAHYAINFMNKVDSKAGQKILINGATGGIGSALLQFMKYKDNYVTAVGNAKNIELLKSLGADKIYNYEQEDFTQDDELYDFIFDAVGKSTFGKCKPLLKKNGIYISSELGPRSENIFLALFTPLFSNKKVVFPMPMNIKKSILYIKNLLEQEKFKPVIDRIYTLEQVQEAYRYVSTGQKTGNVILKIKE